ncbi:sterol desaturase family protein [Gilvimarinus sp. F26214L]|uniref:sterol desaturase family protein n=1 Tax=Gilvimarinus sp. DZF01 TaxID=3461371 RepID=UPI00404569CE
MDLVQLAVPFFILAMGLEFLYGTLRGRQYYRLNDTVNSLSLGVLSRIVDLLQIGFAAVVFGALVQWFGVPQWSMEAAWQWVAAFVAYDFCYYWKHRYGHEWRIMWASHVAHHQSEEYNLSTALRQTGTDYIGFVFYIPLYLAGLPAHAIITVGSLNLIYQFWVHTRHVGTLGPLEWVFITPSNHRVHHARNPEYLDKNYGGVFILWDRLFGTYQPERADLPCAYGITTGLHSWNPVWANFHVWVDTARVAAQCRSWKDRLSVWFRSPGWLPEHLREQATQALPPDAPKYDPPADRWTRLYAFAQFWPVTALSLWVLTVQAELARPLVLTLFGWMVYSLYVFGSLLENRSYAWKLEVVRLLLCLLGAGYLSLVPLAAYPALPAVALGYASISALAILGRRIRVPSLITSGARTGQ